MIVTGRSPYGFAQGKEHPSAADSTCRNGNEFGGGTLKLV